MATGAVVDLDRALLTGPAGRILRSRLRQAGLRDAPGLHPAAAFRPIVELVGRSLVTQLALLTAEAQLGWPDKAVREAAGAAADELVHNVAPYARQLLASHRDAGRRLLLVSAAPRSVAEPLGERLGVEEVVGTGWPEVANSALAALEGFVVWGWANALVVSQWATSTGVDLRRSHAYADNYFAAQVLASVGHPTAVDPDPPLAALARTLGWPVRHLDVPDGVVKVAGRELQELLRPLTHAWMVPGVRFEIHGLEHIPRRGGAIVCFNHRSYFDPVVMNLIAVRAGRVMRGLGKKEVLDAPVIGLLARAAGTIRVERGTGSDEPLEAAARALRAGELLAIAPQGTIPRGPAFFEPELEGRWGTARLAAMTRAPVIPVGLWGTEQIWPRSARLPRLNPAQGHPVTAQVGRPVELNYEDVDADTKRIMAAIMDLLPPEARQRRVASEEELLLTYPPGYRGTPSLETERRPGRDT